MRVVVPASVTEVFKNERRELSSGVMVNVAYLLAGTVGAMGRRGYEAQHRSDASI